MSKTLWIIALTLIAAFLWALSKASDLNDEIEKKITSFHQLYNDRNVARIYAEASPEFQAIISREKFTLMILNEFRELGPNTASTTRKWKIMNFEGKTSIIYIQSSTFEKGPGPEAFVFVLRGDHPILRAYLVKTP